MRLTAAVRREANWYVAQCLEVDVASQGDSLEAALANLKEALELYFENEPPSEQPASPIIAPVDVTIA